MDPQDAQDSEVFDMDGEYASARAGSAGCSRTWIELCFVFIQHHFDDVPIAEIAKHLDLPVGTVKTRLRLARLRVKEAWARYKARRRERPRGGALEAVVPILGVLPWMDAARQVPPLPADVRARIWAGLQADIGGSGEGPGGGDGGDDAPSLDAPRSVARALRAAVTSPAGRVLRTIAVAGAGLGAGLVAGALWDPLHRPHGSASDPAVSSGPQSVTTASAAWWRRRAPPPSAGPLVSAPPLRGGEQRRMVKVDVESALMDKASGALAAGQADVALAAVREHATRFRGGGRRCPSSATRSGSPRSSVRAG